METALYWLARAVIGLVQALPLRCVARLGRMGGALAYLLDVRHRRVALMNLARCFGSEWPARQIRAVARENFKRIGENFACAARTAAMSPEEVRPLLDIAGVERFETQPEPDRRCRVVAIGHFGNFELYARASLAAPGFQFATTYRALRQPRLNRLLQELRARSGCLYFERRTEMHALQQAMRTQRLMIGFLADQHAGDHGLPLPFLGRVCSTSPAAAVFALRYRCPLHVAICYRVASGRWRIEVGEPIPTHFQDRPRSVEAISLAINRAFEAAVRRDPANWFWVHQRWKPGKVETRRVSGPGAESTP